MFCISVEVVDSFLEFLYQHVHQKKIHFGDWTVLEVVGFYVSQMCSQVLCLTLIENTHETATWNFCAESPKCVTIVVPVSDSPASEELSRPLSGPSGLRIWHYTDLMRFNWSSSVILHQFPFQFEVVKRVFFQLLTRPKVKFGP